jgi:hypothetical protein
MAACIEQLSVEMVFEKLADRGHLVRAIAAAEHFIVPGRHGAPLLGGSGLLRQVLFFALIRRLFALLVYLQSDITGQVKEKNSVSVGPNQLARKLKPSWI